MILSREVQKLCPDDQVSGDQAAFIIEASESCGMNVGFNSGNQSLKFDFPSFCCLSLCK